MLTLQNVLQNKVIPWVEEGLEQRLVVAQTEMKRAQLPPGISLGRNQLVGKRVPIRGKRYAGHRLFVAEWPEDHLHELTAPKLVCVVKGITDYVAGKHVITCGEGSLILVPPLLPHFDGNRPNLEGERRRNGYCELLQILVVVDRIYVSFSIQQKSEVRDVPELNCTIFHHAAAHLFNDFCEQAQAGEKRNTKLQQHLLAAFCCIVVEEMDCGREVYSLFRDSPSSPIRQPIHEVQEYIKTNLRSAPTIEKVARHFFMSPRQFTRYLRHETGHSFLEILTACRMEEAKRYLAETPWSIDGIAWLVGFKSPPYFHAFFRRHAGCSPGAYRISIHKK